MDVVEITRVIKSALIASGCSDVIETHEEDPLLAHNELCIGEFFRLVIEPMPGRPAPPEQRPAPVCGVNPITITPRDRTQPYLVMSRLHLAVSGRTSATRGPGQRTVTVMMHHGVTTAADNLVGLAIFNEDHVIDGLMSLFPHGELVVRAGANPDHPWPLRKLKWETSDGREWSHPGTANVHQRELDREGTTGGEGSDG